VTDPALPGGRVDLGGADAVVVVAGFTGARALTNLALRCESNFREVAGSEGVTAVMPIRV